MSEYRSFGSNYHPSSQSRKMSIGVMADSQPKKRNPLPEKSGGEDVIARVEKLKSATVADLQANKKDKADLQANKKDKADLQANKKDKADLASKQRNPAQGTGQVTSPWKSPRSSYRKLGTLSASKGLNKGLNGMHQAPARDLFRKFPQHSDCQVNGGRIDKGVEMIPERMEEPPSAVLQQKTASHREEMDIPTKDANGTTDTLRLKLWEILGKASSANNEDVNSQTPEAVKINSTLSQDKGSNDAPLIRHVNNSDSIETDSESPEIATRRLVTRTLLQRKVGAKGVQKRTKGVQKRTKAVGGKSAEEVNNVFSFEEGLHGKADTAMNSSVAPKKQRGRRKNIVVKCRKSDSREKEVADVIQKEMSKSRTSLHSDSTRSGKRFSSSEKKGSSHELHQQSKAQKQKPGTSTREEDVHHPWPEADTAATPEIFHRFSKNNEKQEMPNNVSREKSVEPENEFQSPTFGYKAPTQSPSPFVSTEASPLHPWNISPALDETETPIFSFGTTKKISQGNKDQASDTDRNFTDFLQKKGANSFRGESSVEPNEDLVLSDSSSDERDLDGSKENSPALGHYNSPEAREATDWGNAKVKLRFNSAKRNSNVKGNGRVVLSPASSLSEGIHKTDTFQQFSEMDEDEGLGRAVALFAVALQNFEKKLKSAANKKSSEIIASVSEEIHLELENVKSHIITEAGKTSNLAKTKRKHAETRLQEQQEKMRMIHEKFKEDVGNHLEDFKNTIEGLEKNHSELKGAIKKQRTTHQKLITQFEGGIETKMDNAAKRIKSVNKSAKVKMMQLKMIVAECLKDD